MGIAYADQIAPGVQYASGESFSCQQTLLIVLNSGNVTNECLAQRISASNSGRRQLTVESPVPLNRRLPLPSLLSEPYFRHVQPHQIQRLLETATDTVHLLHRHNISFPVSLGVLSVVFPADHMVPTSRTSQPPPELLSRQEGFLLFFENNRLTTPLPSRKYSPTRRARREESDLSAVTSLVAAMHVLLRLRDVPASSPVDVPSQTVLGSFLASQDAIMAHACLVANRIANPTPWLAVTLSSFFLAASDFAKCRAVLDAALGGCDAAPHHVVDPGGVLSFYAQRRRIYRGEMLVRECAGTQTGNDRGDKASDPGFDAELDGEVLARLLVCYVTTTMMTGDFGNRRRWRDAVIMFDAYLADKEWDSMRRGFDLDQRTEQERDLPTTYILSGNASHFY